MAYEELIAAMTDAQKRAAAEKLAADARLPLMPGLPPVYTPDTPLESDRAAMASYLDKYEPRGFRNTYVGQGLAGFNKGLIETAGLLSGMTPMGMAESALGAVDALTGTSLSEPVADYTPSAANLLKVAEDTGMTWGRSPEAPKAFIHDVGREVGNSAPLAAGMYAYGANLAGTAASKGGAYLGKTFGPTAMIDKLALRSASVGPRAAAFEEGASAVGAAAAGDLAKRYLGDEYEYLGRIAGGMLTPKLLPVDLDGIATPPTVARIAAGTSSKTANLKLLKVAEDMETLGFSERDIKRATGWERTIDQQWAHEIPTDAAKINRDLPDAPVPHPTAHWTTEPGKAGQLQEAYDNPELFEAYPHLRDVDYYEHPYKYGFTPGNRNAKILGAYSEHGLYGQGGPELHMWQEGLNDKPPVLRPRPDGTIEKVARRAPRIIEHEIQHPIQNYEGWPRGSAPGNDRPDELLVARRDTARAFGQYMDDVVKPAIYRRFGVDPEDFDSMTTSEASRAASGIKAADELGIGNPEVKRVLQEAGVDVAPDGEFNRLWASRYDALNNAVYSPQATYHASAGEVQARNAETRAGYSPEKLRNTLMRETEDVPRDRQIIRYGNRTEGEVLPGAMYEPQRGRYTEAWATHEDMPYVHSGHLSGMNERMSNAARMKYGLDARSGWVEGGQDALYNAISGRKARTGINLQDTGRPPPGHTEFAVNSYTPPGAPEERNLSWIGKPKIDVTATTPTDTAQSIKGRDRRVIEGVETIRAAIDAQGATPVSKAWPTTSRKPGYGSLLLSKSSATPLKVDEQEAMRAVGARYGVPDMIDAGPNALLTNFAGTPKGMKKPEFDELIPAVKAAASGKVTKGVRAKLDTVYTSLEGEWEKGEGSGAVANRVLEAVGAMPKKERDLLNKSWAIAERASARLNRDAEYGMKYGTSPRKDLSNLRKIFTRGPGWLERLEKAVKTGVVLPVVAASVIVPALYGGQGDQKAAPPQAGGSGGS